MYRLKGVLTALVFPLLLLSCSDQDDLNIPIEKSYTDPQASLKEFSEIILWSPNGWNGFLSPKSGGIYNLYFNLNGSDQVVVMYSDVNTSTSTVASNSKYRIDVSGTINPTLIFDPGSMLDHIPMGPKAKGIDKAFTYKGFEGDTLILLGNVYGDELRLIQSNGTDYLNYSSGKISNSITNITTYLNTVTFLYFEPEPGNKIQVGIGQALRVIYITYIESKAEFFGSDFCFSAGGIHLKHAKDINGISIDGINWDDDNKQFYINYNGNRIYANASTAPVIPLHYLLGNEYPSGIAITPDWNGGDLPGTSYKFKESWILDDTKLAEIEEGGVKKGYGIFYFIIDIDPSSSTMVVDVHLLNNHGTTNVARYPYSYTKTEDGIFDFEPRTSDVLNEKENFGVDLRSSLGHLLDPITNNTFRIEFYNAFGGPNGFIPQYKSVEDAEFFFSGTFINY
jgi:hypothetical protein